MFAQRFNEYFKNRKALWDRFRDNRFPRPNHMQPDPPMSPDFTSILERLSSSEIARLKAEKELAILKASSSQSSLTLADCQQQLFTLSKEKEILVAELNKSSELLQKQTPAQLQSLAQAGLEVKALKELLSNREQDIKDCNHRIEQIEKQNAALRLIHDADSRFAADNEGFKKMCEEIPSQLESLVEEKLLRNLIQVIEDAKLLAFVQEGVTGPDGWKDFAIAWRSLFTAMCETLQITHLKLKYRKQ